MTLLDCASCLKQSLSFLGNALKLLCLVLLSWPDKLVQPAVELYNSYSLICPIQTPVNMNNGHLLVLQVTFSCTRRRGGLMVSALDPESNGPGSRPGRGAALCSWARHFTLTVPLSTQVYKWYRRIYCWGVTMRWTSIPSRGE